MGNFLVRLVPPSTRNVHVLPAICWLFTGLLHPSAAGADNSEHHLQNVLHISPWPIAQNLIAGAGQLLKDDGCLFVYGPFKRGGRYTAPSNAQFDATLRAENRQWGVRDVDDLNVLAQDAGLTAAEIVPMPANNLVLAFVRTLRQN
jgi:Protein of unknown function (DUF938)